MNARLIAAWSLLALAACSGTVDADLARDENAYHQALAALGDDRIATDDAASDDARLKLSLAIKQLREDRGTARDPNRDGDGHGGGGGGHM